MKQYSKLEVSGEWSSTDEIEKRTVNISFGSISLNVCDTDNEPISQWAYGSVNLVERDMNWSLFSPDIEESEYIKIYDKDAIEYLLFLSQNKPKIKRIKILKWSLLVSFMICSLFLSYNYHRLVLERLAFSLTSKEQEAFIGNLIYQNLKELSICNSNKANRTISALIKKKPKLKETIVDIKFISSFEEHPFLLPGGTILIPIRLLTGEKGLNNFEKLLLNSIKLQKELVPIKTFFSNQASTSLLFYVFGYFESLKFNAHIEFKLKNLNLPSISRLNIKDKQWMEIRNLCV